MMDLTSIEILLEKLLDKKLSPIITSLDHIKHNLNQVKDSIAFVSNQFDNLSIRVKKVESVNDDLVKENTVFKTELQHSLTKINMLLDDLNCQEQYSRCECLKICGIPFRESETTNSIVKQIGSLAGVEIQDQNIFISHCLAITTDQRSANRDPVIMVKNAKK